MHFPIKQGFFGRTVGHVKAVDDVDLKIRRGETLGLVGESGCGKTTLGRCIVRSYEPTEGEMVYHNRDGGTADLAAQHCAQAIPQEIRMVFQDPNSSLNPRMTLLQIVGEPLKVNKVASGKELEDRVAELLRAWA